MQLFVFVCAAIMVLGGGLGVILRSHPVHAALSLILTLFGIAVMFIAQGAHFLGAAQVIVYAGAIVVLFLFVIMLLGVDRVEDLRVEPFRIQRPVAAVVGIGVVGLLVAAVVGARDSIDRARGYVVLNGLDDTDPALAGTHDENLRTLARDLFSDKVFAFELTSVLLVIAVVGTVVLARRPARSARGAGSLTGSSSANGSVGSRSSLTGSGPPR